MCTSQWLESSLFECLSYSETLVLSLAAYENSLERYKNKNMIPASIPGQFNRNVWVHNPGINIREGFSNEYFDSLEVTIMNTDS